MNIIKCPKCGQEYFKEEIFFPDDFLDPEINIIKDEDGKIIKSEKEKEIVEDYICDKCGTKLIIKVILNFEVKEVETINFDTDYTVKINK
jgi:DNA-directed RNA polymerase subunit RPC12/RpoP